MKTIKNFGNPTIAKLFILIIFFLFNTLAVFAQNSGVWTASGSGASTTWSTTAGGITIGASATSYGAGTGYTLNDFITNDTMGCNNSAYSDGTVVGNPSLSIRHTFPNTAEITFTFSKAVENPVMHFDRLGGGQVSNLTSSTLVKVITPGITFTELSGNGVHFQTTATTVGREAGQVYNSLPSECGPPLDGTASGSVRLNGVFQTITFELSMDAVGSTSAVNDRFEITFSDVQAITLDFDGVDDYISRAAFLGNKPEVTMMTWIKLDNGFDGGEIMGQRNLRVFLDASRRLKAFVKTNGATLNMAILPDVFAPVLTENLWYHVAVIYDAPKGSVSLYLNGDLVWQYALLLGSALDNSASWNSDHDFEIGRNSQSDNNYFEGSIYETRVYSKVLTNEQLQQQIHQEIVNNAGTVRGAVVPKDIVGLAWSDLELYYKMEPNDFGYTPDMSTIGIKGDLHGMRTYQDRTAPLPYVTKSGGTGNWQHENNWLHGDVWDIEDAHSEAAIIKISEDLVTNIDHRTVGLIIDNGAKLKMVGDSGLHNSWYLKLDGEIDLEGESQLIQSEGSELDVTSSGSLEKDQQGTRDLYTYNYWSSPVGVVNATMNNTSYSVSSVFKDGTDSDAPQPINFISSGYNGSPTAPITIADYWIWKFANQLDDDYSSWQHVRSSGSLKPGEGFTMKGIANTAGNISLEQNYTVKGKPNNGDISLPINAGNDYLVGNPYASAIDAHKFIEDNAPTIEGTGNTTGTLYFWEHWGGGSHVLSEYQGGYATYNLAGAVPAVAYGVADPDVDQSSLIGTKLPGRYIPVGQGFFVVGENTGTIKFKNSQRTFRKEGVSSSVFMRTANGAQYSEETSDQDEDLRMKIRLKYNSPNTYSRKILVTGDANATLGQDWGYDAALYDNQVDDMFWMIEENKYVIQGVNTFDIATILPLGINTSSAGENSIAIDNLENIPGDMAIFLHDLELGIHTNLRESAYSVTLPAGEHLNRFEIVFSTPSTLGVQTNELEDFDVNYINDIESIVITNPKNREVTSVSLLNILGQTIFNDQPTMPQERYKVSNLSTGTYIIKVSTVQGSMSKKVIIK